MKPSKVDPIKKFKRECRAASHKTLIEMVNGLEVLSITKPILDEFGVVEMLEIANKELDMRGEMTIDELCNLKSEMTDEELESGEEYNPRR